MSWQLLKNFNRLATKRLVGKKHAFINYYLFSESIETKTRVLQDFFRCWPILVVIQIEVLINVSWLTLLTFLITSLYDFRLCRQLDFKYNQFLRQAGHSSYNDSLLLENAGHTVCWYTTASIPLWLRWFYMYIFTCMYITRIKSTLTFTINNVNLYNYKKLCL